jgi:hypothetical protein
MMKCGVNHMRPWRGLLCNPTELVAAAMAPALHLPLLEPGPRLNLVTRLVLRASTVEPIRLGQHFVVVVVWVMAWVYVCTGGYIMSNGGPDHVPGGQPHEMKPYSLVFELIITIQYHPPWQTQC